MKNKITDGLKTVLIGSLFAVGFLLLGGCSKTVEYELTDTQDNTQTYMETVTDTSSINEEKWEEILEIQKENGQTQIWDIHAQITIPATEQLTIAEVEEPLFDASFKKKILRALLQKEDIPDNEQLYEEDTFTGTRNDISYNIDFYDSDFLGPRVKSIFFTAADMNTVCPPEMRSQQPIAFHPAQPEDEENLCMYSREEALQITYDLLKNMGFSGWVCEESTDLCWQRGNAYKYYGYEFVLSIGYNDQAFVDTESQNTYWTYSTQTKEPNYSNICKTTAAVTDEGVIELYMESPLFLCSVTELSSILSIKSIYTVLKHETEENPYKFEFLDESSKLNFNSMDLVYFRVANKKEPRIYSFIPAWRLSFKKRDGICQNMILINAFDGSIINPYEEI